MTMNTNIALTLDFLLSILENIDEPLFVKDANHNLVLHNDQFSQLLGRTHDEIIGKSDFDFFHPNEAAVSWEKDDEVFNSGKKNVNFEYITNSQHITRFIKTKKSSFLGPEGEKYLVGVVSTILDKESIKKELRNVENRTSALDKAKNRFLSNVSHEIRTPLYSIIGFTELLLREEQDTHKQELLMAIRSSGSVLLNIVNDLLDTSKIEEGKGHLNKHNFNLQKLFMEIKTKFETQIEANGNRLDIHFDETYH